jgi:hypothetical protein
VILDPVQRVGDLVGGKDRNLVVLYPWRRHRVRDIAQYDLVQLEGALEPTMQNAVGVSNGAAAEAGL